MEGAPSDWSDQALACGLTTLASAPAWKGSRRKGFLPQQQQRPPPAGGRIMTRLHVDRATVKPSSAHCLWVTGTQWMGDMLGTRPASRPPQAVLSLEITRGRSLPFLWFSRFLVLWRTWTWEPFSPGATLALSSFSQELFDPRGDWDHPTVGRPEAWGRRRDLLKATGRCPVGRRRRFSGCVQGSAFLPH